jgi:IclR helix-turn-helix domain
MKRDANDTLRAEGDDAVRDRIDEAHRRPTLDDALKVFDKWLLLADQTPILAVLGAVAANYLDGDPVWLGLVGPPSSAKTEILNSTSRLPHIVAAATLTPAGLLSGTPKKQRVKGAAGGLLQQLGDFGIIALKDFGSILSMRPDAKAEVLACLREVYDGAWTRHVGSDGGRTLHWHGKIGLIFASTSVIDSHYGVIGAMGDRFLLSRLAPVGEGQFARALQHAGPANGHMRAELAEAVEHLFAGRAAQARAISSSEIGRLDEVITLVVRLRAPVERDRHTREVEAVYGAEGTARLGLQLERLLAGLDVLGVERKAALAVVQRIAMDSVPPLRRAAYQLLRASDGSMETGAIAAALGLPTSTVRRALEDLAAYRLAKREPQGAGKADLWTIAS